MSEINGDMQNKKKGLGRGLGSLLQSHGSHTLDEVEVIETKTTVQNAKQSGAVASVSGSTEAKATIVQATKATVETPLVRPPLELSSSNQDKMWMLSIEKLKSGKYQPRKHFDKQALEELSASIKLHGILQPLIVRSVGTGQFEIIAGERRWRAAQLAGLHEVPVIIKTYDNQKTLELSLIENLQREDLNPIEEAEGYQRLMNDFALTQEKVAEKVGKERATVANALRLLKLAPEVRDLVQIGKISQGHAKVLLAISDFSQQKELAKTITDSGLSVRKLEVLIQKIITPKKTDSHLTDVGESVTSRLISGLSDEMQKLLGTRVNIDYANAKGKMSIYFYSDDELTQIIEKLRGAKA
jgi:ParB family transcriptional regulator, chromosome partitioning protein